MYVNAVTKILLLTIQYVVPQGKGLIVRALYYYIVLWGYDRVVLLPATQGRELKRIRSSLLTWRARPAWAARHQTAPHYSKDAKFLLILMWLDFCDLKKSRRSLRNGVLNLNGVKLVLWKHEDKNCAQQSDDERGLLFCVVLKISPFSSLFGSNTD